MAKMIDSGVRAFAHFAIMGSFANSTQLFLSAYLKNFDYNEGKENWSQKFVQSMKVSACIWPAVHMYNY